MDKGLIPRRYAKALLEVAQDKGLAAEIYSLMQALCRAFDAEPALQTTLANPFVSDADKEALLLAATGDAGAAKDLFSDYLVLLARNGRLDIARGVALSYIDQYRGENDIYSVEVESAAALSDESRQRIKELIAKHVGKGTLECTFRVEPSLIGGFRVKVGSERLDASIASQLSQLRLDMA